MEGEEKDDKGPEEVEFSNPKDDSTESADATEDSAEEVVTLGEVIEMHDRLQKDAEAVLGGASHNTCTYPEAYKPRQPLYSCLDCIKEGMRGGVCYGCSISCHDGHQLIELYTKRNFCCDCGNSKFKEICLLYPDKMKTNPKNKYDHNFDGNYCVCDLPYPSDEMDDDMAQCAVCEDWFHLSHLLEKPESVNMEEVAELICKQCASRLDFVYYYTDEIFKKITDNSILESAACRLTALSKLEGAFEHKSGTVLFTSYLWRSRLCKCQNCMNKYEDLDVTFLTDVEDSTVAFAEANFQESEQTSSGEASEKILRNTLTRQFGPEGAIVFYKGIEDLKNKLFGGLKRLHDEGREIRKEDINAIFGELQSERKRRREE